MTGDERILIVDDNVNLARGFATALAFAGYDVSVAHTAEEGLKIAHAVRPHGIILDFRMPLVNGVGFLYRLRRAPDLRGIQVMVVTGATVNEETRADLRELGAVLRFKPLGMADLVAETDALLEPVRTALLPLAPMSPRDLELRDPRRC